MTAAVDERIGTPRVMELTRASKRQLEYWVRCGYLRPDNALMGPGVPLLWPPSEVAVAVRIVRLLNLGFLLQAAIGMARYPSMLRQASDTMREIIADGAP